MATPASMAALRRSRNFWMERALRKAPKAPVVPIKQWRIARGDLVEVIARPAVSTEVGKQGKVIRVDRKNNRVYVEGIAMVGALGSAAVRPGPRPRVVQRKKAVQPQPGKEGGLLPVEGAIHYSNVALVDPSTQ
jgi:ribosomal protein L24